MRKVDAVIIGAGIQGAGIAQAMAAAGYSVIVLEQTAVASATSQASSKLIHGGLRYLETAQFSLVKKSLQERDRLLRNAPELVKLVPFYIPVYKNSRRKPWQIHIGLGLYALLDGFGRKARFNRIVKADYKNLEITEKDLVAVYQYYDAQTDDQQLTRAVMYSATQLGAEMLCPAQFVAAHSNQSDVNIDYMQGDVKHTLSAKVLINATGPWVNQVLENITPDVSQQNIDLVQGIHLVLDLPAFDGIYYVEAPQDGRAVFIMPWKDKCLIGTTETIYHGDPNGAKAQDTEINYLLDVFNHFFPGKKTRVLEVMSGLRVLPNGQNHSNVSTFKRRRDTMIVKSKRNVISVYGGKLTTYRSTAEEVMQSALDCLPAMVAKADTRTLTLTKVDASVFPHGR